MTRARNHVPTTTQRAAAPARNRPENAVFPKTSYFDDAVGAAAHAHPGDTAHESHAFHSCPRRHFRMADRHILKRSEMPMWGRRRTGQASHDFRREMRAIKGYSSHPSFVLTATAAEITGNFDFISES